MNQSNMAALCMWLTMFALNVCSSSATFLETLVMSNGSVVEVHYYSTADDARQQPIRLQAEFLRERCTSPLWVMPSTNQQYLNPHEFETPLVVSSSVDSRRQLQITFTDGHKSTFDLAKLERELRGERVMVQVQEIEEPEPALWDASMQGAVHVVSFEDLQSDEGTRYSALTQLLGKGIIVVSGVPKEEGQCVKMANFLSTLRSTEWGDAFNVRTSSDGDKEDLAYSASAIGMHTDNAYRDPTPDFQLLHAIDHCTCPAGTDLASSPAVNCAECTVFNTFADGFHVAERLAQEDPRAFELLSTIPVWFENNGGDNTSALLFEVPHFQLHPQHSGLEGESGCTGGGCLRAIRFSFKSGGYAPAHFSPEVLGEFYAAKRKFSAMIHSKEQKISLQLGAGDMAIFDNTRVLHARSSIAQTDGNRYLQGCYLNRDGIKLHHEKLRRRAAEVEGHSAAEGTFRDYFEPVSPAEKASLGC